MLEHLFLQDAAPALQVLSEPPLSRQEWNVETQSVGVAGVVVLAEGESKHVLYRLIH